MGEYKRGDIYFVESAYSNGSEQQAGRPAIVVSNQPLNDTSQVLEMVYLTTQPKKALPTHVTIYATGRESTALCEQISSISIGRLGDYCGRCTEKEIREIDRALAVSLGIETNETAEHYEPEAETPNYANELIKTTAQLEMIKALYKDLLKECINKDNNIAAIG